MFFVLYIYKDRIGILLKMLLVYLFFILYTNIFKEPAINAGSFQWMQYSDVSSNNERAKRTHTTPGTPQEYTALC